MKVLCQGFESPYLSSDESLGIATMVMRARPYTRKLQ